MPDGVGKLLETDTVKILRSPDINFNFSKITGYMQTWGKTEDEDPFFSPYGPLHLDLKHGLSLYWYYDLNDKINPFPVGLSANDCVSFVTKWLESDEASKVRRKYTDTWTDHDGDNGSGWRVYKGFDYDPKDDWDRVVGAVICTIRPVVLWYGK